MQTLRSSAKCNKVKPVAEPSMYSRIGNFILLYIDNSGYTCTEPAFATIEKRHCCKDQRSYLVWLPVNCSRSSISSSFVGQLEDRVSLADHRYYHDTQHPRHIGHPLQTCYLHARRCSLEPLVSKLSCSLTHDHVVLRPCNIRLVFAC